MRAFAFETIAEFTRHLPACRAVVMSHSLDQEADVCQRVMGLDAGRLRDLGPTNEALDAYAKSSVYD